MSARAKILVVTPRYHPESGGVEEHVSQIARRGRDLGFDVTVLTTDRSGTLPGSERRNGVEIIRVPAWPRNADYRFAPQILGIVAGRRWDLVHVQSYHTFVAPLAMLGAVRARVPFVLTFHAGGHSSRIRHRLRPLQRQLLGPLLRRAARLVALTQGEVETYTRELHLERDRFAVIPNGVDRPTVATSGTRRSGGPLIASIGRLERYKGHHRVIEAMPEILQSEPAARLWIGGAGSFEPNLRRLAQTLGIASRVEIRAVPADDRDQMAARLAQADVVVLLSEFETQPIAALEAAALGRPLLVADTPGLSEIADAGFAQRVGRDADAHAVAAAVLRRLETPPDAARMALPTWDDCASRLYTLYSSIIEHRCASSS